MFLWSSGSDLLLDWLQDVQNFSNVAILGLQKAGEPASLVGESHVHHCLQSNLDLGIRMRSNGSRGDVSWRVLRQGRVERQGGFLTSRLTIFLVSDDCPVLLVIGWSSSSLSRLLLLLFLSCSCSCSSRLKRRQLMPAWTRGKTFSPQEFQCQS